MLWVVLSRVAKTTISSKPFTPRCTQPSAHQQPSTTAQQTGQRTHTQRAGNNGKKGRIRRANQVERSAKTCREGGHFGKTKKARRGSIRATENERSDGAWRFVHFLMFAPPSKRYLAGIARSVLLIPAQPINLGRHFALGYLNIQSRAKCPRSQEIR